MERPARADDRSDDHLRPRHQAEKVRLQIIYGLIRDKRDWNEPVVVSHALTQAGALLLLSSRSIIAHGRQAGVEG